MNVFMRAFIQVYTFFWHIAVTYICIFVLHHYHVIPKVLWLSRFFSNYQFISFGGCYLNFWWFEQSRFNVFIFFCQLSLSKKKSAVLLLVLLWGHFLPLFFRRNTLTCVTPKEKWNMFILFLLGLRAININMNKNSKLSTKRYF